MHMEYITIAHCPCRPATSTPSFLSSRRSDHRPIEPTGAHILLFTADSGFRLPQRRFPSRGFLADQVKPAIQDGRTFVVANALTVNSEVSASLWASSLPDDLVRLVASRLLAGDLLDYVRFRAVCAPRRSGTTSPHGLGIFDPRFHPRRWMMLPEGNGLYPGHPKLHGYVRFFNLDTGAFVRVHIPLFEDHCILDSYEGLLVLQRDHDTAIRLLHPFTGDILELPPLSTLLPKIHLDYRRYRPAHRELVFLRDVSTAATFADGVVTVMLAFTSLYRVAVATSQDQQWTISTWFYEIGRPLLSSQGKTYLVYETAIERTLKVFQIDTPLPNDVLQPPKLIATCAADKLREPVYFEECDSEVLVIGHHAVSDIRVYKLADLVMERYIPVTSIGDKAILIQDRALSVSTKASPTIPGDTIIYTAYNNLKQYHLRSGTRLPAMDQCSFLGMEPGPCSLIQHIVTCCSRGHW
ncbi:hypothetical protein BAE44_0020595 [Dichanthelium oligosanthes]|uniref:KIB1-4 beta-propeller domain-containing protein n=1 Tax=Dichanthelium oligosanthes TaxID=888268 RepID=A0A1E5UZR7_9POAL|nr:hypothetical protein BAE44_0020595 [Dichanthelium oligosanthes]